jgi:acyl-CoA synthetase (AMP-forming)/AMP-acid ligase II
VNAETMPALVRESAERFGARTAIIERAPDGSERSLTFVELAAAVDEAARAWLALGVARGDRVALWAPNSAAWQIAALGAHAAGAVLVPLNTRWKGGEAAFVLERSRARALLTVTDFLGVDYMARLREVGAALPALDAIVVASGAAPTGTLDWSAFRSRARSIAPAAADERARAVAPDDLSDLIFTAGTTGRPKGVACTHAQTLRVFRAWSEIVGLRADDRYLVVNPYFHTFGYKAGWLACLLTGAACLPEPVFDVARVLERIERDRVTVLPGPPTLYQALLHHADRACRDLASLRLAVTGAAVIPVELVRRMRDELRFETVLTAYGLTESCGVVTMCRAGDPLDVIAGTSGRPIPGVEVRVVGVDGVERPRGEPGEVCARGYNVMRGYWEDAAATASAIDADGWLHTGDVGVIDEGGNLRITDRLKDMFIVGGFNAYPAEIESAMLAHPAVAQVAVVGVPDERLGEVGFAFVVPRPGVRARPREDLAAALVEWARCEMANYKAPRFVELVDELPLSPVGKVLKYVLRERAAKLRAGAGVQRA